MKNGLTNVGYVRILATIGESNNPLSSHEVMKEMIKKRWLNSSGDKDLMRKLRTLNPLPLVQNKRTFLMDWDKFCSDLNSSFYTYQILKKIVNRLLKIEYQIGKRTGGGSYRLNDDIYVTKKYTEGRAEIGLGSYQLIIISIDIKAEDTHGFILYAMGNEENRFNIIKKVDLSVRRIGGKTLVYLERLNRDRIWFLTVTLNKKAKSSNPILNHYWKYLKNWHHERSFLEIPIEITYEINNNPECMKIINDSRYWKYSLNPKGFMLYLLGESKICLADKESSQRIRNVLSNLEILRTAPFLEYWETFELVGFDVIKTLKNIGKDFGNYVYVQHLKDDDITYMVTQRYSEVLEQYLSTIQMFSLPANASLSEKFHDLAIRSLHKKYLSKILTLQREYLMQKKSAVEEKLSWADNYN